MIYVMTCGCRLTKENLKRTRQANKCCPEHPKTGRVKFVEKHCIYCSDLMVLTINQTKRDYCPKCLEAHTKKIQQGVNRRREARRKKDRKKLVQKKNQIAAERRRISINAWDCAYRDACLNEAPVDAQYLSCYKCNRYMLDTLINPMAA